MELSFQSIIGGVAGTLSAVAYVLYIVSTVKGPTRPNRATWSILTLVGLIILMSYYNEGARETIWVPLAYVLGPLIITLFAIKYGEGGWKGLDKWCLTGAIAGALLWTISGSALLALLINIGVDLLALLPTIKKAYLRPEGEDRTAWALEAAASFINLAAVKPWTFSIWIYPVYLAVFNGLIAALLIYGRYKKKHKRLLV